MTVQDLKQLRVVIREEVGQIVEEKIGQAVEGRMSEVVEEKIGAAEGRLSEVVEEKIGAAEGRLSEVVEEKIGAALKPVNQKLDALWDQTVTNTEQLVETLEVLKAHHDKIQDHSDNFKKVNKRLQVVENQAGITHPAELNIVQ